MFAVYETLAVLRYQTSLAVTLSQQTRREAPNSLDSAKPTMKPFLAVTIPISCRCEVRISSVTSANSDSATIVLAKQSEQAGWSTAKCAQQRASQATHQMNILDMH
jgi:hypothetical protein